MKFKVGDKVRAITNKYFITTSSLNWEGVVVEVWPNNFRARTTKCDVEKAIGIFYKYLPQQNQTAN